MLDTCIDSILHSKLPLAVCLGIQDSGLAGELENRGIPCIQCPLSEHGMGNTLADGMLSRPPDWQGVIIALADMPLVKAATFSAIASHILPDRIVVPYYDNRRGNPVGFGSDYFAALAITEGDRGGAYLVQSHPGSVYRLTVKDTGIHRDIDTMDDLAKLQQIAGESS